MKNQKENVKGGTKIMMDEIPIQNSSPMDVLGSLSTFRLITGNQAKIKPQSPKYRLGCGNEIFIEAKLKGDIDSAKLLSKFGEVILEREKSNAKYQKEEQNRRAEYQKKQEENAENDK